LLQPVAATTAPATASEPINKRFMKIPCDEYVA
jgi:hypothetical protein